MDKIRDVHHYKQETTRKGSMKIEVVVEEAKKPKKERPGSASSIRNIEDIQKRQKVGDSKNDMTDSAPFRPRRRGGGSWSRSSSPVWRRNRRRRRRFEPKKLRLLRLQKIPVIIDFKTDTIIFIP